MKSSALCFLPAACLCSTALFFQGCSTRADRSEIEAARKVTPMVADEAFFDGKIAAHLTLGSTLAEHRGPDGGPGGGPGGAGGAGGRHHGGGGRHGGGGMGGGRHDSDSSGESGDSEGSRAHYSASTMPPALLRLSLKNNSAEGVDVEIRDLNSELGNFAARPDKFTIAPADTGEPDPMQSLLGVESMALPVTLTLRSGGKTETKVLTLRPFPSPAAAAPPSSK
ncbi:MAG: hypothetical protein JWM32_592 [Verrucomicrobia bacterium]|nr:hypothetical protein [Verrucomicrobiota bacterium]